jgi:hypothetical protein
MARRVLSDENNLRKRIFRIVRKNKMCDLDELILECTSFSWTDVFLEIDQLSRSGELRCCLNKVASIPLRFLGVHSPVPVLTHMSYDWERPVEPPLTWQVRD